MLALFGGRMGRRRYWAWVGAVIVGSTVLAAATRAQAGGLATATWLCAGVPRLHDLGRSGWWAAGVLAFIAGALAAATLVGPLMVAAMSYLSVLLELALVIWLGLADPDPCENRWGRPLDPRRRPLLAS
jgi:uncharacterized membrane protein YhaH (DUF805 family)